MSVITQNFHSGNKRFTNKIQTLLDNIINKTMQTIKFYNDKSIKLNGIKYKPYNIGNLPPTFGFISRQTSDNDIQQGIYQWFNYKGFTYVAE